MICAITKPGASWQAAKYTTLSSSSKAILALRFPKHVAFLTQAQQCYLMSAHGVFLIH